MKSIVLGTGLFPGVAIVDDLVYVAYGLKPAPLVLVVLTREGTEVRRQTLNGFDLSFPTFGGRWLAYKRNVDWRPTALNVVDGQSFVFQGQADGNFGLVVNDVLGFVAYQWTNAYQVWLGSLIDGVSHSTPMTGAPDGLSTLASSDQIVLRKDVRTSVPGMLWPVRRGDLTVGELPDFSPGAPPRGAAVQLDGDVLRVAFANQDTPTPSCATDGQTYAIVTGGPQGVRLLLGTRADVQALPLATPLERVSGPIVNTTTEEKETSMIAYGLPIPGFSAGEEIENVDGTVSIKKPNGKFLCVTPEGKIEERDHGNGAWENFRRGKNGLIAERDGGRVYVLPRVE